MRSFRFRMAGVLGLGFVPAAGDFIPAIVPPLHAEAPAKAAPKTFSRTPAIRLPLQLDERTRAGISELKLYVKKPGADWVCVQSGPPTQKIFDFRADKDGEHCFMFVTVDRGGRATPSNLEARAPHQIIVVDTAPPELGVHPLPVANREIFLKCQVRDANPDWSSVKLEYLDADGSWAAMAPKSAEEPGVFRIPHASILESRVRATAKDKAGNASQRELDLGDPTQSTMIPLKSGPDKAPTTVGKPDPLLLPPDVPEKGAVQTGQLSPVKAVDPLGIQVPEIESKQPPVAGYNANRAKPVEKLDLVAVPPIPDGAPPIIDPTNPGGLKIALPADGTPPHPNTSEKVDPFLPPIDTKAVPLVNPEDPAKEIRPAPAAHGTHPIINTTRCTLDYAVENVIVGGQPKMEFWATRDGGKSWNRVADEAGGRSPAKLLLPGDGMYGVRVKANGNGMPPQPGEAPDAWVEVDTIVPTVRLGAPTLGTGPEAGTLTIPWMVHDRNLAPDCLTLFHSSRPEGPWLPIATGLRNEGSYRWLIPAGVGTEVYLRLEATDKAGNLGRNDLREPVAMPQPKVRVIGIGPAR